MLITLMTDASVCPHTGAAGYGYWVVSERSPGTHGQGGLILKGYKDSFSGELHGVYLSIKESIENGKILKDDYVLIQLDNAGVVNCINNVNKVRDSEQELMRNFRNLLKSNSIKYKARHVKGHSKDLANRYRSNYMCDMRAGIEMRKIRDEILGANNA